MRGLITGAALISSLLLLAGCAETGAGVVTAPSPTPRLEMGPDGRQYTNFSSLDDIPRGEWFVLIKYPVATLSVMSGNVFKGHTEMDYLGTTASQQLSMQVTNDGRQIAYLTPPAAEHHVPVPRLWLVRMEGDLSYTVPTNCGHQANFYVNAWVALRVLLNYSLIEIERTPWSGSDSKAQSGCQTEDGSGDSGGSGGGSGGGGAGVYTGTCFVMTEFYEDNGDIIDQYLLGCF